MSSSKLVYSNSCIPPLSVAYPFQLPYYSSMAFWHSSSKFEYLMSVKLGDKHCTNKVELLLQHSWEWDYFLFLCLMLVAVNSQWIFIALDSATNLFCSFTHSYIKCMLSAYYMPDTGSIKTRQAWFSSFGMHWNHLENLLKIHMPQCICIYKNEVNTKWGKYQNEVLLYPLIFSPGSFLGIYI